MVTPAEIEALLGFKLQPWQRALVEQLKGGTKVVICCPPRNGKRYFMQALRGALNKEVNND